MKFLMPSGGRLLFFVSLLILALGATDVRSLRAAPGLDYEYFRTKIEPIFLKPRAADEGSGRRCVECHSRLVTGMKLQPLQAGATAWTEEQSRQNFQAVSAVVMAASDPLKSPLLVHPLAPDAGGDPSHTGGKFWKSKDNPEWQTIAAWVNGASVAEGDTHVAEAAPVTAPAPKLDFEFFRTQVQPIFLKKRPGLARCYECHGMGYGEGSASTAMHLQPLSPGATMWDEEQSRKNFEVVSQKVVAGDPASSLLLLHPLRYLAGGTLDHMGGWQFLSTDDPDWQTLAAWVEGETVGGHAANAGPNSNDVHEGGVK